MTETVLVLEREDRGPVTILTLNRPNKLNALSNDLLTAMMSELDRIELDSDVRVVVITGAGRAFSAAAMTSSISATSAGSRGRRGGRVRSPPRPAIRSQSLIA